MTEERLQELFKIYKSQERQMSLLGRQASQQEIAEARGRLTGRVEQPASAQQVEEVLRRLKQQR